MAHRGLPTCAPLRYIPSTTIQLIGCVSRGMRRDLLYSSLGLFFCFVFLGRVARCVAVCARCPLHSCARACSFYRSYHQDTCFKYSKVSCRFASPALPRAATTLQVQGSGGQRCLVVHLRRSIAGLYVTPFSEFLTRAFRCNNNVRIYTDSSSTFYVSGTRASLLALLALRIAGLHVLCRRTLPHCHPLHVSATCCCHPQII